MANEKQKATRPATFTTRLEAVTAKMDLERARVMERPLVDAYGEGMSVATMAKRFNISQESIRTVLGTKLPETEPEPKPQSRSILTRLQKRLGF